MMLLVVADANPQPTAYLPSSLRSFDSIVFLSLARPTAGEQA
jgi:hypothetical protein